MDALFRLPFQYGLQKRHESQSVPYLLTPSTTLARMYYDLDVLSRPPFKHTTLSLHIGGSSVYGDRTRLSRDFDGIMILPTFRDILRIIALIAERCLVAPELITHHPFEVVRFSGTSTDGQKKSIKILSFQFLQVMAPCVDKPCVVPVLSLKDRRNFHASVRYPFGLQPVTSDASDSVHILHDADILLRRNRGPAASQRDAIAFGCTMDLLLTSHMVHLQVHQRWAAIWRLSICRSDVSPLNLRLWHHAIFQKFLHACDCSSSSHHISVFARSASFSIEFCRNLAEKLGVQWPTDKIPLSTGDDDPAFYLSLLWPPLEDIYMCQERASTFWTSVSDITSPVDTCQAATPRMTLQDSLSVVQYNDMPFAHNGIWGTCTVDGNALFWKRSPFADAEVVGARLLSQFVRRTRCQRPAGFDDCTTPPIVFYPFVRGETVAQIRLRELQLRMTPDASSNLDHRAAMSDVLRAALIRSDDMLHCWMRSLSTASLTPSPMRTGIHRYFVDRLRNHARMLEYYGNGLSWDGFHLTFDELLNVNILINGRLFPPLSVLFRLAEAALEHARQDPSLHVVGHGDLHGGNIIVRRTGGSTQLLYVDYETVGRHSPWIDIAKPIYNDCFFVYRYADHLGIDLFDLGAVRARVNNDTLDIDFKSSSSRECPFDPMGKALFEVLIEGLLRPFECHLKQQREELSERDLHDCLSLSHALLACALLGRNFSQRPDMFFASLAIGVTLSQTPYAKLTSVINELL